MVDLAVLDGTIGRVHLQAGKSVDELFRVDGTGGLQALRNGHQRRIADDGTDLGRLVEALFVGFDEGLVGRGVDGVPGVAGDDPAGRRVGAQRFQVLGFAGQERHDGHVFKQAARVAFAHEAGQIGGEQHIEDGVGLGVGQCLHDRAGIHLAQRHGLFGDEFDVGLERLHHGLERGHGGLAVFVIGIDDGPALLAQGERLGGQRRHVHPGGGTQAVSIAVAFLPGDLVGQRLGGQEEHLLLLGEVGQCETRVGKKAAEQQLDFFARQQLLRGADRVAGVAVIVARDDLKLSAQHAARGVDFFKRQLPTLLVRAQKGGNGLVAVDLADADGRFLVFRGGGGGRRQRQGDEGGRNGAAQQGEAGTDHGGLSQR